MSPDKKAGAIHKAIMPLGSKAIVSHIIDRFPEGTRFIVAVGYLADQVKNYIGLMHPELPVSFVDVPDYDSPKSGPGLSLLACQPQLQGPFYAIPADTLFELDLNAAEHTRLGHNWAGVGDVADEDTPQYTTFAEDHSGRIIEVAHKERRPGRRAWNGLLYVHDHALFWSSLADPTLLAGEHHVTNGMAGLINSDNGLYAQEMGWRDVGTYALYRKEAERLTDFDFSKTDEAIYFSATHVVKMFVDAEITRNRVAKAALRPAAFPPIDAERGQFYRYPLQPGQTFYTVGTPERFTQLLAWCKETLWKPADVQPARMAELCDDFYRTKTLSRLGKYHGKYPDQQMLKTVNGEAVVSVEDLLGRLRWAELSAGVPVFMHGDLQFDNILLDEASGRFNLLDWRQDFAGAVAFGDIYYDMAKLYGGILLNYDYIKKNLLSYTDLDGHVWIDFAQRLTTPAYAEVLRRFVGSEGLDFNRVELLTAVIFLNMAPLHHAPFDKLLYALSTSRLSRLAEGPDAVAWFRPAQDTAA